ncbi:MAG: 6-phosphofructokinase [bacterium]
MKLQGKNILVFTGGGITPALNPTLYGVISEAKKQGAKITGGFFGWASLSADSKTIDLTSFDPEPIKNIGGSFLRSSRTNPFADDKGVEVLKKKLQELVIDYVIAIGGDDTLGAAEKLFAKEGIKIIGVPKTIDNDLMGTYWTPGYPSAAHYAARYAYEIKVDAAYALSRVFVIELYGRQSGWLVAAASHGLADVIVPPEKEVSLDKVMAKLQERYRANGNFATIVISEEAKFDRDVQGLDQEQKDDFDVKRKNFVGMGLKDIIIKEMGVNCRPLFPGNFMQTGAPIKIDQEIAIAIGTKAVQMLSDEKFGFMPAVSRPDEKSLAIEVAEVPLSEAVGQVRFLDDGMFDYENFNVTEKYFNYTKPFLDDDDKRGDDYFKMVMDLNK